MKPNRELVAVDVHCWAKARTGMAVALALALAVLIAGPAGALAAGRSRATVTRLGAAPGAHRLSLVLPLHADLSGLERFAASVTTFGSPNYGQYEPIPVLARRFGASSAVRNRVLRFLRHAGAAGVRIDRTGLFADATMPVSRAEAVFGTALARYAAGRSTRYIAPTRAARVPEGLSGAVGGVIGLNTRPVFGSGPSTALRTGRFAHAPGRFRTANTFSGYPARTGTPSGCSGAIAQRGFTPNQYLTAYNYAALQGTGITGTGERVALIEIDGYRYSDLTSFASCFGLPVPAVNAYGVNLSHPLAPGGESTLDLEVLDAAAPGLKAVDVYETRARASDVLQALTAPLQNGNRVPEVISASLGTCEPALEISIGSSGVRSVEGALALAAASGISVLSSSGDNGSSACAGRSGPIPALEVSYPASSPWVTGVGGTNVVLDAANRITAQIVWNDAPNNLSAGGGGISRIFTRPGYQRGFEARNRRGVPDVSMLADVLPGYDIYCTAADCARAGGGAPWIAVGGTSAASPLLAGGFALVDELLRQRQRQNLGQANSLLYHLARHDASTGVFSDLNGSDNDLGPYLADHRSLGCCSATPGYDLATGIGSVDLLKLAGLATTNQPGIARLTISLPRQRPLAHRRLLATLRCTGRAIARVAAEITISGGGGVAVSSNRHVFARRGRHTLTIGLSRRQVNVLRGAIRRHRRVYAHVFGELIDSGGNVEGTSRVLSLRVTR